MQEGRGEEARCAGEMAWGHSIRKRAPGEGKSDAVQ